jgi:hypothetical protein
VVSPPLSRLAGILDMSLWAFLDCGPATEFGHMWWGQKCDGTYCNNNNSSAARYCCRDCRPVGEVRHIWRAQKWMGQIVMLTSAMRTDPFAEIDNLQ